MNMMEVTETRVSCRRPVGLRIGMGVAGSVFSALCLALLVWIWPSPATLAQRSPADIFSRLAPTVGMPLVGLCFPTIYFLYLAGPEDLILDTVRRTDLFRRGFPLLASWKGRWTISRACATFDGRASLSLITVSYLPAYPHTSTLVSAQTTRTAPLFLVCDGLVLWTILSRRDDR